MKRKFLESVAVALPAPRSLGVGGWATHNKRAKPLGTALPTGKRLQTPATVHALILIFTVSFAHATNAVTLQEVLDRKSVV